MRMELCVWLNAKATNCSNVAIRGAKKNGMVIGKFNNNFIFILLLFSKFQRVSNFEVLT